MGVSYKLLLPLLKELKFLSPLQKYSWALNKTRIAKQILMYSLFHRSSLSTIILLFTIMQRRLKYKQSVIKGTILTLFPYTYFSQQMRRVWKFSIDTCTTTDEHHWTKWNKRHGTMRQIIITQCKLTKHTRPNWSLWYTIDSYLQVAAIPLEDPLFGTVYIETSKPSMFLEIS